VPPLVARSRRARASRLRRRLSGRGLRGVSRAVRALGALGIGRSGRGAHRAGPSTTPRDGARARRRDVHELPLRRCIDRPELPGPRAAPPRCSRRAGDPRHDSCAAQPELLPSRRHHLSSGRALRARHGLRRLPHDQRRDGRRRATRSDGARRRDHLRGLPRHLRGSEQARDRARHATEHLWRENGRARS
jgi:hypothetical protein